MSGLRDTLSYQNFSWQGDPRWASTSKLTGYAPHLVSVLCLISMVLVALGSTWLVQMTHVTFPKVFQTLFIPGLSFFNTLPSLHAHLLLRRNPPRLAMTMGICFILMMLLSPILMLGSCINSPSASASLRQAECYAGTPGKGGDSGVSLSIWSLMIVFSFLSAMGYGLHVYMAWRVHRHLTWKQREGIVEAPDPEEEERKKQKAHELWVQMARLDRF